jgi:hypothetical protein
MNPLRPKVTRPPAASTQPMRLLAVALLAIAMFALGPPSSTAVAQTATVFSDATFNGTDWGITNLQVGTGGGGAASGLQANTGGNPGDFRRVFNVVMFNPGPSPTAGVFGIHLRTAAVYDPSSQGAIKTIDYSEDAILFSGSQSWSPALMQGGAYYLPLPTSSFLQYPLFGANPDFSGSGGPITFGFVRGSLTVGPPGTAEGGIDNWFITVRPHGEVTLTPVPGLSGVGIAALAVGLAIVALWRVRKRAGTAP